MIEVFALVLYSVQWLGIVLGVGAETVLLAAHLVARHSHKPEWLAHVPGVRGAQGVGLILIVVSGAGAVWYHLVTEQVAAMLIPTFGFKWLLIGILGLVFVLERTKPGRAAIEGLAGASWYALFLVHSVAPVAGWTDLTVFFGAWLLLFGTVWGVFIFAMKHAGVRALAVAAPAGQRGIEAPNSPTKIPPKPRPLAVPAATLVPEPSKPIVPPVPKPVPAPMPSPLVVTTTTPRYSLLRRFVLLFARQHAQQKPATKAAPVPQKIVAQAPLQATASLPKPVSPPKLSPFIPSAPLKVLATDYVRPAAPKAAPRSVPQASNLPAIEYLELLPPHPVVATAAPAPVARLESKEVYDELPTIRVMPKSPEDLAKAGAAAMVQFT